jgi:Cysteine/serine-rich nuclear protein N-terminus
MLSLPISPNSVTSILAKDTEKIPRESTTSVTLTDDFWSMDVSDILIDDDDDSSRRSAASTFPNGFHTNMSSMNARLSCLRAQKSSVSDTDSSSDNKEEQSQRRRRSKNSVKRSVSFDKVKVRVFERVLSTDSVPQTSGPSLGLGWIYTQEKDMNLEKFEKKCRGGTKANFLWWAATQSNTKRDIHMTPEQREKLAKQLGYSASEIQANVTMVNKVLLEREQTVDEVIDSDYEQDQAQSTLQKWLNAQGHNEDHGQSCVQEFLKARSGR